MASPTLARKGSSAYEKGIREGRAMSAKARRAPEPGPDESEELENEEEEMDMDMGGKAHSGKRSAKGAKNTKAPMDGGAYGKKPMDAECGCKGKKGGKCDGNCGGAMRKRGDAALTPHEYLDACALGVQDRSRSYIRARLDAAARLDLKCGKGAISKGEKCTKGAATQVTAVHNSGRPLSNRQVRQIERGILVQEATTGKKVKMSKEQAALLIGTPGTQSRKFVAASLRPVKSKNLKAGLKSVQTSNDPMDRAVSRVARRELFNRRVQTGVRVLGGALALSGIAASAAGRRDSPYASGFPLDTAALAI
jgi:hypothetical protein